ncbi:MAG: FAD-binding oxidoreductase [Hyphomonadaceae bacterium]|nr:FAD-binding oxidoreductase [Hyphomonadaceae bacterium]
MQAHRETPVSWGRVLRAPHDVLRPSFRDQLPAALAASGGSAVPYGLGRSYGDSCLNPNGALIAMRNLDRFIAFDGNTGVLRAEGGVSLAEVLELTVPAGWFLPTTSGTRFVTLGGAVANDVHGKNHHQAGSFCRHVRRIGLVRSDSGAMDLAAGDALFDATAGGLGLTGLIAWVEIHLAPIRSAWLTQETIPFSGLDGFFELAESSLNGWEFTVAWVDCTARGRKLGRGIFSRANWSEQGGLEVHARRPRWAVPVEAPSFALNPLSLAAFNALYQWQGERRAGLARAHYSSVFYPLDAISHWNRLYGARGFYQYQSVVPLDAGREATRAMLDIIARSGQGSFLAVLKTLGPLASPGIISFPQAGVTLALDFANRGQATLDLLARLDAIVLDAGGRLYPAKDGRMTAALFQAGYPRWRAFAAQVDPVLSSAFWRRVSA